MNQKYISVRINDELFRKLKLLSALEMRSISRQAMLFLRESIERYEKEKGKL